MASSLVPAVPCTSSVDSPLIAAARCSETQLFAVPGTPSNNSARSVASVAMAISIRRRLPMYLGDTSKPFSSLPPRMYVATAHGESFQFGGRVRLSCLASSASSWANCCSKWSRITGRGAAAVVMDGSPSASGNGIATFQARWQERGLGLEEGLPPAILPRLLWLKIPASTTQNFPAREANASEGLLCHQESSLPARARGATLPALRSRPTARDTAEAT